MFYNPKDSYRFCMLIKMIINISNIPNLNFSSLTLTHVIPINTNPPNRKEYCCNVYFDYSKQNMGIAYLRPLRTRHVVTQLSYILNPLFSKSSKKSPLHRASTSPALVQDEPEQPSNAPPEPCYITPLYAESQIICVPHIFVIADGTLTEFIITDTTQIVLRRRKSPAHLNSRDGTSRWI